MRDPFSWSLPLGRAFGITIRIHVLFPFVAIALLLRVYFHKPPYPSGSVLDTALLEMILFVSVLLHEFGHCFGARLVDGDAQEILMWPLGGLAFIDVPHRPWAHFVAVAGGPAVNVLLCLVTGGILTGAFGIRPPFELLWYPFRSETALAEL